MEQQQSSIIMVSCLYPLIAQISKTVHVLAGECFSVVILTLYSCFSSDPSRCLNSLMSFLYPSTSSALLLSRLSYQDSSFSVMQFFSCFALNALKFTSTYICRSAVRRVSLCTKTPKKGLSAITGTRSRKSSTRVH